jgi:hypothetical protein
LADEAENELTKPSKPGSVGFVGAIPVKSPEIEADPAELARASDVLNRAGVRIVSLEGGVAIGIWSDLDGPEVRAALRTFGSDQLPVHYLDGAGVPMKYKLRQVEGEPVPMAVLAKMERSQANLMQCSSHAGGGETITVEYPWTARDRMLGKMEWRPTRIPWEAWKAVTLNRLFREQGVTGSPGRIKAATVRHGEGKVPGRQKSQKV